MEQLLYRLPFIADPSVVRRPAPYHRRMRNAIWCVDFAMPQGTPVVAARDGIIVFRESRYRRTWMSPGTDGRPANSVTLRHDDGQKTFYSHLAWRSLRHPIGARVSTGEVIALSGQTGYATYPHLHFGVFDADGTNIRIPWIRHPEALPFLRVRQTRR